jgi:hypothetical protein
VLLPAVGVAAVYEPAVGAVGVRGAVDADEVKSALCFGMFVECFYWVCSEQLFSGVE